MTDKERRNQHRENQPAPFYADLELENGDMLPIAEAAKEAFDCAVEREAFVITDTAHYEDIPYHNGLATPAIILSLKGRKLNRLSVQVPKKDSSTAITITAYDAINPKRKYIFTEFTDELENNFIIDDTDWVNATLAHRPVDSLISHREVAHWLYRQAGLTEPEISRRLKTESDPVQDAAHVLSTRATRLIHQRQVRVDLSDSSQFFGEEIAVYNPDELHALPTTYTSPFPVAHPLRLYTTWINQGFETEAYGNLKETLLCTFSPDDPALAIPNFRSTAALQLETDKTRHVNDLASLFLEREKFYKNNIANLFNSATGQISASLAT